MTMRPLLLTALALSVPLAGCGEYRGLETAHQPVIAQTDYTLDLIAGPDGLAGGEAQRLHGWLDVLAAPPGTTIAIDDPAAQAVARSDIATIAGEHHLRLGATLPAGAPSPVPGTLRVVVTRATASVPSCQTPGPRDALVNFDAHTSNTFGCATSGNLAAMVADPLDLLRGKVDDGRNASATAAKAIGAWRKAVPTGTGGTVLKSETTGGR
ncbi:CpaD family pilus assembly lipoprotein [Sphingomonas sp. Leaf231]|uniref:CpaD family pilus assembly lipoprotein n=1 Tax=Sphingomonas sp. Leaf231 TaxID=1736301 RepID=UPI000AD3FA48|nr:CpaD family pilus assembly lipoprotein [Sphingomonas sp. Leaf231]